MSDTLQSISVIWRSLAFLPVILLTVKAMVFPVVMYGCESSLKKSECRRTDAFGLWYWRILLRVPWTIRWSNQSILKSWIFIGRTDIEGPLFGHLMERANSLEKTLNAGKDWRQEEKQVIEDETVGWYHRFNGNEFEQAPGDCEGQEILVCCSP